ncbi:MAG TPA: flavodoxin [Sunxiuqinia sp.]|nr:flavodoxin [Sunxiuqinia sp.]
MSKIGLFFGPEKGSVDRVARKIAETIGEDKIELVSVNHASAADLEKYDKIIFGISTVGKETWDSEYSNTDWSKFFPEVRKVDYSGKTMAIFGLGDHITYPEHFVNAMGRLAKELQKQNGKLVGGVEPEGYEFEESEALVNGSFVGLPLDEDFEPELTNERVDAWLKSIQSDFGF